MCQEKASYLSTPPFKIAPDYPKKGQSNEEQLVLDDSWWQVFEVEHIYALLRCSSGVKRNIFHPRGLYWQIYVEPRGSSLIQPNGAARPTLDNVK